MNSSIRAFRVVMRRYFTAYGGIEAVFLSPLFILSILISIISYENILNGGWVAQVQAILPNLLGFSLGTYSILFSILTPRLKSALKAVKNEKGTPYLYEISATFMHFITVQCISIIYSILYSSNIANDIQFMLIDNDIINSYRFYVYIKYLKYATSFFGMTLLSYSILLIIAAALAIYRISSITEPNANAPAEQCVRPKSGEEKM